MTPNAQTRRGFLRAAGAGAAALAGAATFGPDEAAAETSKANAAAGPLPLGLTTYMVKEYDLDQTLAMARRVAVDLICLRSNLLPLESTPEEIAAVLAKVTQAGLKVYGGGVIYMKDEAGIDRAFAYAKAAGFKLISINLPPDLLPALDRKVRQTGIRAAIHNHGPEDKHYPTPPAIHEKVKGLDPRIGICHDTGHTLRAGMDPVEATVKTADRILDVHLKDVDGRTGKSHSTELGRGVMDIPAFLQTLARIGYRGVLGIEYEKHMTDLLPGLAESVGYTRGVQAAQARGG
ncbi:MAG TPA: sugar phosphate isomerase/epimerase family protein [Phycisphaerae bacterium]|nr:sugar phosphate isomerase/epimerase family protein [Phycisphaerae bacterium]HUU92522.1 sugar phosphate isomerase/epimerase family protein [Phycisphaerae bacterium]